MKDLHRGKINLFVAISMAMALLFVMVLDRYDELKPSIKIGVLHSLSGMMAASETPLVDAVRLAVEEAN